MRPYWATNIHHIHCHQPTMYIHHWYWPSIAATEKSI